jgi:tetratricopeptide (TPR) repeat protein
MCRVRAFLLPIQLSVALLLSAQADVHQLLDTAAKLALQGNFAKAAELARSALNSAQLTHTERGRGWTLLGSAYQNQGEFQVAMTSYENALRVLEERSEDAADYASALIAFGTLYRDMLQFDAAAQMEMHALHVDQQINDHRGIAVACANLADLELGSKHLRKAQAWLDDSDRESKLASNLDEMFYAFVASSEAWLAELRGNPRAAIAGHQKEITYLTHSLGKQNPTLGWAYMLLGKAYLKNRNVSDALSNMENGCAILRQAGPDNPRYLLAQVEYAEALESAGMHAEAVQTKREAEGKLRVFYREQCTQCRITSIALH